MIPSARFRRVLCVFAALFVTFGSVSSAQPLLPVESFDLILVGDSLGPAVHKVEPKSNPSAGTTWETLDEDKCTDIRRLMVIPDQSVQRYLRADLHNYYVPLRITVDPTGGTLRAAYALPSVKQIDANACAQLAHLMETEPIRFRRHSLAVYERPRPVRLHPGTPFVDRVEAPVRHRKAGTTSVRWMEVLFPPTNYAGNTKEAVGSHPCVTLTYFREQSGASACQI